MAGAMLLLSCGKKEVSDSAALTTAAPSSTFYVRTAPVTPTVLEDVIHVTGVIQSDTEAKPSFKTAGVIARTFVKEGDAVQKGQLLARLNLTEIEAQSNQARLALEKAQRDLQRVDNLYKDSIATLEQFQNATTAVDIAKKSLQIAEFNTAYSEVRSPIDGKVVSQFLHEGEITGPGIPVYYIIGVKVADWKIVAGLTDRNWGQLKPGDKAAITLDAYPGWSMQGVVKRLADVANPMSGTFDVEISIPAKDKRIAAGMLAHVEIKPALTSEFPLIPIEALVSSNGRTGIVYVPENGIAVKKTVLIQEFRGEQIAIQSGLNGATEVITAGSGFLEDGDKIVIEK